MRIIETKIYTIDEHPDKQRCFEWIRDNWHDLNQHSVDEIIESVRQLSETIGGTFDYCISAVPDRGEHISFFNYDSKILKSLKYEDCPLTGVCWDHSLIKGLQCGKPELVLEELHNDTEYMYSDEGLEELCEANVYEFTEDGKIF